MARTIIYLYIVKWFSIKTPSKTLTFSTIFFEVVSLIPHILDLQENLVWHSVSMLNNNTMIIDSSKQLFHI